MSNLAARTRTLANRTGRTLFGLASVVLLSAVAVAQMPEPPPMPTTQSPSGRTQVSPPAEPPTGAAKYAIDKRLMMFQKIRDDAIFPWSDTGPRLLSDFPDDEMEARAYDEVIRHARQFTTAELGEHARRDLTPKDLYTNGRLAHKLELVYFQGLLRKLSKAPLTETLKASGVTELYEAWIFPEHSNDAVLCVYVTELPAGITVPAVAPHMVSYRVGIAGYYFKLLKYESGEASRDEVGKNKVRRAPVLMGRSLTLLDESMSGGAMWRQSVMPLVVGGVGLVAFTLFGLSWYFRRTDASVRREIENKLTDNPFANG